MRSVAPPVAPAAPVRPATPVRRRPNPEDFTPPPHEQYFVKAQRPSAPIFDSPPSKSPRDEESWAKPIVTVVGILVAAVAGFLAVQALKSDSPAVNMGTDDRISEVQIDSLFGPLEGYRYRGLPPAVEQQADQLIDTMPGGQDVIKDVGVRAVTRGSDVVGVISSVTVTPEAMEEVDFRTGGFEEMEEAFGARPEKMELGGLDVYSLNLEKGSFGLPSGTVVVYFYENAVVFVFGFDETTAHDITTQLANVAPQV